LSDVHPLVDVENFQFSRVDAGIYAVYVYLASKIRSGGKATPEAPIYSIAVIYSYLLLVFLNVLISSLFTSIFEGKVVPRAEPVPSTLNIASEV
jgi:hypothetical protein